MHFSAPERIIAGLAAAYWCYLLVSGLKTGIIDGEGDLDVHADVNPAAYALTAISSVVVIGQCTVIAFGIDGKTLSSAAVWLWNH